MRILKFSFLFLVLFCAKEERQTTNDTIKTTKTNKTSSNIVRLGTLEWPPYIGTNLPNNGYVFEVVQQAFEKEGLKVEIEFYPFARLFPLIDLGELDGYFPEYWNEELSKVYDYSEPFQGGNLGFMKLKDRDFSFQVETNMQDFHALKHLKIGVVRGYTNTSAFDSANYLQKEATYGDINNLKKLLFRRVDLILIDPNVANYLIETHLHEHKTQFQYLEPSLEYKPLYVCFRKTDNKIFLKKFNQGLKQLELNGDLQKILEKNYFMKGRYVGIQKNEN